MMKKLLLGSLLVSSAALAVGPEAAVTSSAAVSSNEVGTGKYFYNSSKLPRASSCSRIYYSAPAGLVSR